MGKGMTPAGVELAELQLLVIQLASISDTAAKCTAVNALRKRLRSEKNPPIDVLIELGILPILVDDLINPTT
jgi:hypothetical protein